MSTRIGLRGSRGPLMSCPGSPGQPAIRDPELHRRSCSWSAFDPTPSFGNLGSLTHETQADVPWAILNFSRVVTNPAIDDPRQAAAPHAPDLDKHVASPAVLAPICD